MPSGQLCKQSLPAGGDSSEDIMHLSGASLVARPEVCESRGLESGHTKDRNSSGKQAKFGPSLHGAWLSAQDGVIAAVAGPAEIAFRQLRNREAQATAPLFGSSVQGALWPADGAGHQ